MQFNFNEIKTTSFESLPENRYPVVIESVDVKKTNDGLKDMMAITYVVSAGEYKNRKVWDNITLSDTSLWRVKQLLETVGSDIANKPGIKLEQVISELKGKALDIYTEPETTNTGNPTNKVKKLFPATTVPAGESAEDIPAWMKDS